MDTVEALYFGAEDWHPALKEAVRERVKNFPWQPGPLQTNPESLQD